MKLLTLIKACLNETYIKVHIGNHLSQRFPIQDGVKQGDALSPLLYNFVLINARPHVSVKICNVCLHSRLWFVSCLLYIPPLFWCPEIGISCTDWAQLATLSTEDRSRIRLQKRWF
jgi:hypothetical protein